MGGGPPPTNTRLGTAIGNVGNVSKFQTEYFNRSHDLYIVYFLQNMSERPITQHGLSGLPTAQSRLGTANRMIKDKRYWQAQLQMKMNEITRETEKLHKERLVMDRERSAKRSFEKKVKEATKELTSKYSERTFDIRDH